MKIGEFRAAVDSLNWNRRDPVSYTHLRAHETVLDLVCRLLLENKKYARLDLICYYHHSNNNKI